MARVTRTQRINFPGLPKYVPIRYPQSSHQKIIRSTNGFTDTTCQFNIIKYKNVFPISIINFPKQQFKGHREVRKYVTCLTTHLDPKLMQSNNPERA
ncbi:hypothetical protein RHMOL_Rhmol10G0203500 [Rhododendron molle]|uniref:Uncharacterized protein n=1 Tax=Rhododendron molle TaxID=49168 RepID=A0ACC0M4H9_RHOML|nr:hypothetical protein RHMOL_Rhmol10G0203500 [Rhododendron molle]